MEHQIIHLTEYFPFLGENGKDPTVERYSPTNMDVDKCRQAKRPCLLVIPGGGYSRISPREDEPLALHFMPLGYHIFILRYTPGPEHNFPTQIREVAALTDLIRTHAEDWLCDTAHIAIMGFSAGGHLAAHYSNAYNWPEVQAVFPNALPVQACILAYSVISADPRVAHSDSFENLLGHPLSDAEKERFSCQNMVSDQTPPTFLWHTAADQLVPVENSLIYARALADHKIPFELHIFPLGRHGLSMVYDDPAKIIPEEALPNRQWLTLAQNWLRSLFL